MRRWSRGRAGAPLLLAALVALAACAQPQPRARIRRAIVGGTEAPVGAYPEAVAIMDLSLGDPASYFCTGTLIAPDAVLSAAHCMFDWQDNPVPVSDVGVYFGHDAQSVPLAEVKRLATYFVPQTYPYGEVTDQLTGMGRDDDIALLVLEAPVTDVTPAPILDPAEVGSLAQGTPLLLVGFGQTTVDNTGPEGIMYYASSPAQTHSDYEILIGAPGQPDTCFGDSGGPAFLEVGGARTLVGVTVRGTINQAVECGDGTINTLAPAYLGWIETSLATVDGGLPQHDAGPQRDGGALADGGISDGRHGDGKSGPGGDGAGGCAVSKLTTGQRLAPTVLLPLAAVLLARRRSVLRRRRHRTPDLTPTTR